MEQAYWHYTRMGPTARIDHVAVGAGDLYVSELRWCPERIYHEVEEDKGKYGVAVGGSYLSKQVHMPAMQLSKGSELDVNNAAWTRGQVAVT